MPEDPTFEQLCDQIDHVFELGPTEPYGPSKLTRLVKYRGVGIHMDEATYAELRRLSFTDVVACQRLIQDLLARQEK